MGDGLARIFHIALALVNAKGGVATIDEFENGLYWEVQRSLWPLIFKMAEGLDIQLFVTTHSSDCLRGFISAWQSSPDSGTLHRLERDKSHAVAVALPMANVADAVATDVEVR
jgi:AAA15 family ATPase/GTPase